jgi:heterodisulfide reductase subunit B
MTTKQTAFSRGLKIPYYPGCTLKTAAGDLDGPARLAAASIGFEMEELKEWNCCGASYPLTPDNIMGLAAPARVLLNAGRAGDTLMTLCSVCYNVLKRTNRALRLDNEKRGVVNGFMEADYDGGVEVLHYLEVLRDRVGFDRVRASVRRPLKGIKAGAYYGCMLLRPFEDAGVDDAERPTVMEDLLKALGAEPVEFPDRIECCGAHLAMSETGVADRLSGAVMRSAALSGAELMVTSCPLCRYNLEMSRARATGGASGHGAMPVVYFTQALGLALGHDAAVLGLAPDALELFRKKGVV